MHPETFIDITPAFVLVYIIGLYYLKKYNINISERKQERLHLFMAYAGCIILSIYFLTGGR